MRKRDRRRVVGEVLEQRRLLAAEVFPTVSAVAASVEHTSNLPIAARVLQAEGPSGLAVELQPANLSNLRKSVVAGDPDVLPGDTPGDRVDANILASPFSGVGSLFLDAPGPGGFICTATALTEHHIVSAAHCLDSDDDGSIDFAPADVTFNLNFGSDLSHSHTASALHIHPDYTGFANPSVNDDLAVIELASPLPAGVDLYPLSTEPFNAIMPITIVGYGKSGDGVSGFSIDASLTVKRAGANLTDFFAVDDEGTGAREIFEYDFDLPDGTSGFSSTPGLGNSIETTLGPGDSGGPALVEDAGGQLRLFGVNTFSFDALDVAPLFGSGGGGTVIEPYADWIESITSPALPGITVSPTAGLLTSEDGASDTFSVVLDAEPTANVSIGISSSDPSEGTTNKSSLTFTPSGGAAPWNDPQVVTVNGVNDSDADGDIAYSIVTDPASGAAEYLGIDPDDVAVTNIDNEVPPAILYFSLRSGVPLNGIDPANEDIVAFDGSHFEILFDGSEVGIGGFVINAFAVLNNTEILMSFDQSGTIPGVEGLVDDTDIVLFSASAPFGEQTAGSFSLYFDGSDVGLNTAAEDIDALDMLENGDLLISTRSTARLPGLTAQDEDVIRFELTSVGESTAGSATLYLDGSDLALTDSREDVDGLGLDADGRIYLSTVGRFNVVGSSGADEDVFQFTPAELGPNTSGNFDSPPFFDGSLFGLSTDDIWALDIPFLPTEPPVPDNDPPTADAGGPYAGPEGSSISLSALGSFDTDGSIVSYDWDLDDDGFYDDATGPAPTFFSAADGSFPISVMVIDDDGATDTDEATVTVTNVAPTADAGGPYATAQNLDVTVSAAGSTDPGGDIATYEWDLDNDGLFNDAVGPTAVFNSVADGVFTISVRVTDDDGAADTDSATVTVANLPPQADAGGPYSTPEGTGVPLDASDSTDPAGSIVSYAWDFDNDGIYDDATGPAPTFTSAIDGIFPVSVLVTDDDGASDTDSTTVTVTNVAPTADAGGPYVTSEGVGVIVDAGGSTDPGGDIVSYEWDLDNDGAFDDATGVTAAFSALEGSYTVGVRVTDDDGASDTDTATVTVTAPVTQPVLFFSLLNSQNIDNLSVTADDIVAFDGTDFSLFFDGSDVGVGGRSISAFAVISVNEILLSFSLAGPVPGISDVVDDSDIVKFTASSLGSTTTGSFSFFFDGSDVGLSTSGEDIDALEYLPGSGSLVISTRNSATVSGATADEEDLLEFVPSSLGTSTAGNWSVFYDGSDVGLNTSKEDVDAVAVDSSGDLYLSTTGRLSTLNLSAADEDISTFHPTAVGDTTSGSFLDIFFNGSDYGLSENDITGFDLPLPAGGGGAGPTFTVIDIGGSSVDSLGGIGVSVESVVSVDLGVASLEDNPESLEIPSNEAADERSAELPDRQAVDRLLANHEQESASELGELLDSLGGLYDWLASE